MEDDGKGGERMERIAEILGFIAGVAVIEIVSNDFKHLAVRLALAAFIHPDSAFRHAKDIGELFLSHFAAASQ